VESNEEQARMKTEPRWQTDQPSEAQHDAFKEYSLLLEVIVEQPGATSNLYRHDRERGAILLEGILRVETPRHADLARYPLERQQSALERIAQPERNTSADRPETIPSLPVLLLSTVAVAPGTWVSARLIGAMRSSFTKDEPLTQGWLLLGVPAVDASQEQIVTIAQLAAERRAHLAAFVAKQEQLGEDMASESVGETIEWLEAPEAARLVRQARATWRQTERQRQAQTASAHGPREHLRLGKRQAEPTVPVAWRAIEGVSLQQIREHGLGAYAEAEHLLRFVPQRFQQYLSELLLDDERVLCFIERPRLRKSRGLLGLGARYLNEGLLLCTDRQVLWLRDVAAPDATLVPWGYVARSCPVERLAGTHLVPGGQAYEKLDLAASPWVRLVIQSEASQGMVSLVIEFPETALPALQQATALLERFLPFPNGSLQALSDHRVRRLPEVSVWQPRADEQEWLLQLGGIVPAEAREYLEAALKHTLHPGEQVLAQALAPALSDAPGGPRLLALTSKRLLFGQTAEPSRRKRAGAESPTTMQSVPLERVAAVQLRRSLLGCVFEIVVPEAEGGVMQPYVPFNSPAIVPFRAVYTRTRVLLAAPFGGALAASRRETVSHHQGGNRA
jgi:inorganic pyrophosphatase